MTNEEVLISKGGYRIEYTNGILEVIFKKHLIAKFNNWESLLTWFKEEAFK